MEYCRNGKKRIIRVRIIFCQRALRPFVLGAHFVTLWLIFTPPACQAKRKGASRSDHDKPTHRSSLEMIPIWVLERKLAGLQMKPLSLGSALLIPGLICSLQERRNVLTALSYLLERLRRWDVQRRVGNSELAPASLPCFRATWRASAGRPASACDHHPAHVALTAFMFDCVCIHLTCFLL